MSGLRLVLPPDMHGESSGRLRLVNARSNPDFMKEIVAVISMIAVRGKPAKHRERHHVHSFILAGEPARGGDPKG